MKKRHFLTICVLTGLTLVFTGCNEESVKEELENTKPKIVEEHEAKKKNHSKNDEVDVVKEDKEKNEKEIVAGPKLSQQKVVKMMVEGMKEDETLESLKNQDLDLADKVIEEDTHLNNIESDIYEKAILVITQQQPVASDLRNIMGTIKVASDVERIGDIAVNIAKSVKSIGTESLIKPIEDIPKMAQITQEMLTDIIEAYRNGSHDSALQIAKRDDEVDKMYDHISKELVQLMSKKPENTDQLTQLAFICRNIERVGDHVTNIAESILFVVKGVRKDLN